MEGSSKLAEAVLSPLIIGVDKLSAATTGETATSELHDNDKLQNLDTNSKDLFSSKSLSSEYDFIQPENGTPAADAIAANAAIKINRVTKNIRRFSMKRPSIRQRKGKQGKNIKGKVIDNVHELHTLTMGMMLGLKCSVSRHRAATGSILLGVLSVNDFSYEEKRKFPPKGDNRGDFPTPPHSLAHSFSFKSYAPKVFQKIRDYFDIDTDSYMNSVCGDTNYIEFLSNSKSGQFFFYSHDGKYMIKTQSSDENKFMKKILLDYYGYLKNNPNTLLVRILGMHRVIMYHLGRKVHFVIMASVFDTPQPIHTIYDLKGSLIGREASKSEREKGGVLKDSDLVKDERKLHLGKKRHDFLNQLEQDANFLAKLDIMDYSLLVGIHERRKHHNPLPMSTPSSSGLLVASHSNVPFRQKNLSGEEDQVSSQRNSPKTSRLKTVMENKSGDKESSQGSPNIHRFRRLSDLKPASLTLIENGTSGQVESAVEQYRRRRLSAPSVFPPRAPVDDFDINCLNNGNSNNDGAVLPTYHKVSNARLMSKGSFKLMRTNSKSDDGLIRSVQSARFSPGGPASLNGSNSRYDPYVEVASDGSSNCDDESEDDLYSTEFSDIGDSDLSRMSSSSPRTSELLPEVCHGKLSTEGISTSMLNVKRSQAFLSESSTQSLVEDGTESPTSSSLSSRQWKLSDYIFPTSMRFSRSNSVQSAGSNHGGRSLEYGGSINSILSGKSTSRVRANSRDLIGSLAGIGVPSSWKDPSGSPNEKGRAVYHKYSLSSSMGGSPAANIVSSSPHSKPWTHRLDGGINSNTGVGRGDEIYYVGVIDILQKYNINKRMETFMKSFQHDSTKISSVNAKFYAKRFVQFIRDHSD